MRIRNGWKAKNKQNDKIMIKVRFGILTLFDLNIDFSSKRVLFTIFNFSIKY